MEEYWREQEARVRAMVELALAVGREAARQQLERQMAKQLMEVEVGNEKERLFEYKVALAVVNGCFETAEERLDERIAGVLEEAELQREWDGE